jgi:hypothetical protein
VLLTASAKPQNVTDSGLAAATASKGSLVVAIDEPACSGPGGAASAAAAAGVEGSSGNPAVQVIKVSLCWCVLSCVCWLGCSQVLVAGASTVGLSIKHTSHVPHTRLCPQVEVGELAPSSVTEYAWRLKFTMAPPKDGVKFSDNATVKNTLEVRVWGGGRSGGKGR